MIFQQHNQAPGGVLQTREVWDSVALTHTVFDGAGAQLSQRPLTAPETAEITARVAATTADTNSATLRTRAAAALATNATYLAITTPSAAQNAAQAKALTRQVNALIKLLLNELEDTAGT